MPENQKKAVRTVMKELFKVAPPADDEDTIMKNFQHYCETVSYTHLILWL